MDPRREERSGRSVGRDGARVCHSRRVRYWCVNSFMRDMIASLRPQRRTQLPPDVALCCEFLVILSLWLLYNGSETTILCSRLRDTQCGARYTQYRRFPLPLRTDRAARCVFLATST